jgi:hypothetical protein
MIPRIYFISGLQALDMGRSQPEDHTGRTTIYLPKAMEAPGTTYQLDFLCQSWLSLSVLVLRPSPLLLTV